MKALITVRYYQRRKVEDSYEFLFRDIYAGYDEEIADIEEEVTTSIPEIKRVTEFNENGNIIYAELESTNKRCLKIIEVIHYEQDNTTTD